METHVLCGHLLGARTGSIFNLYYFLCILNLSKIRTKLLLKTEALKCCFKLFMVQEL